MQLREEFGIFAAGKS